MFASEKRLAAVAALSAILVGFGSARARGSVHTGHEVEQTDPITGLQWKRIVDPQRPAAPPRLAIVTRAGDVAATGKSSAILCVRAGDRVQIASGVAESPGISLAGTALAGAACNDRIRARVIVTGAIVLIRVSAPGVGTLVAAAGVWQ